MLGKIVVATVRRSSSHVRLATRAFSDSITYSGGQASQGQVRPSFLFFFVL